MFCLPFFGPHMRNRKGVNRIFFLNLKFVSRDICLVSFSVHCLIISEQVITVATPFTAEASDSSHIPDTDCFAPFTYPCKYVAFI